MCVREREDLLEGAVVRAHAVKMVVVAALVNPTYTFVVGDIDMCRHQTKRRMRIKNKEKNAELKQERSKQPNLLGYRGEENC